MIKTLLLNAKSVDTNFITALDENEKVVIEYDGYVPDFFPGEHYGDYVQLDIDVKTGVIKNWPKLTQKQIKEGLKK